MISHAQGLGELDQDLAAEECGEIFDTAADTLEYIWEVVRPFSVLYVSSHGYQNLQGRVIKEANIPGSRALGETEIPQLQAHYMYILV